MKTVSIKASKVYKCSQCGIKATQKRTFKGDAATDQIEAVVYARLRAECDAWRKRSEICYKCNDINRLRA